MTASPAPSTSAVTASQGSSTLVVLGRVGVLLGGLLALLCVIVGWDWANSTTNVLSLLVTIALVCASIALLFVAPPKLDLVAAVLALVLGGMIAARWHDGAGRILIAILAVAALLTGALLILASARLVAAAPVIRLTGPGEAGALPANWYPDPQDPAQLRYWDGTAWTEHRHPAAGAA